MTRKPNVLLIHGLLSNPVQMSYMGRQLEDCGFNVHYVFYRSVMKSARENSKVVSDKIQEIGSPELHLVAHSLGGLVLAHMFDREDNLPAGRIVTLGTPIKGSWTARSLSENPITSPFIGKSLAALSGETLPDWQSSHDWGMIAGRSNTGLAMLAGGLPAEGDGTVLVEETFHPAQKEHIIVDKTHTGLLFSKTTAALTADFLMKGQFKPPSSA